MNNNSDIVKFFQENKYVVLRNFIDSSTAGLLYRYTITKVMAMDYKSYYDPDSYNKVWDGEFGDPQAPSSYSNYGDMLMDTLLTALLPAMSSSTGLDLVPNYTYWRFYQKGEVLERHKDRYSCEISATMCLGYDTSNIEKTNNSNDDYNWPIFIKDLSGEEIPVKLYPGDILIYKGSEVEHWREEFKGLSQSQVFLHYNDSNSSKELFDGRPMIGIPKNSISYHN